MTIRDRLTLRFSVLVLSILLLSFMSIYAFCWYFIASDFYRRLDRKAATVGDMLIRHRLNADLIRQLSRIRRDQLPNQTILVFDARDTLLLVTGDSLPVALVRPLLTDIRRNQQQDFRADGRYVSGSRYTTATGQFVVVASAQNSYGDAFLARLRWALGILLGLVVGITALAGRLFAGDALRPMQAIEQGLARVFPHNQHERLPLRAETDEINRLSATINRLLDRVAEVLRGQRLFVANVSHELKNPLTQISSQLEVSLLRPRDPESYRQTIRSVLEDITSLSALTHELLQLSQLSQDDAHHLLTDEVRADELTWDVRQAVMELNPRYQVSVTLGTLPDDPDGLLLRGNRTLLFTALKNLTENACKYGDNGHARLRTHFEPDEIKIEVENTGRAIPRTDQPYLFEPFYRARQTADEVRGYGVGLSLVARIVALHGGRVSIQSGDGLPTVFRMNLPR